MNNVNLSGRITKDIELKMTKAETPMVQFTLACKRKLSNSEGEKLTDFFNCVAFGPRALFLSKYACKSTVIGIEGRLQSKVYVDEQDNRHQTVDVICESVEIFRMPRENQSKNVNIEDIKPEQDKENNMIDYSEKVEEKNESDDDLDDFNRMMNNFSSFFD